MLTFIAEAAVRSSALIAAVWLLLRLSRTRAPAAEKLVWTVVLGAMLVMPLLTGSVLAGVLPPLEIVPGTVSDSMVRLVQVPGANHPLRVVILTTYILGVAVLLARLVGGLVSGAKLRRGACRIWAYGADLDVRLSAQLQSPVSFGATVLLPANSITWEARMVRAVLAHEREHIRNHDGYRLWLALLCRAVFWFNPFVHWLYRRLMVLTELTSDAAAAGAIGDRSSYVDVLLQLATERPPVQPAVPMARRSTLPVRIRRLLAGEGWSGQVPMRRKVLLAAAVALVSGISACTGGQPLRASAPLVMPTMIDSPDLKDFYPDVARRNHEQGVGIARVCLDTHGDVTFAGVQSSSGNASMDAAMVRLAEAYHFKPATRGGKPVGMCTLLPVRFKLAAPQS
ncbi:MAG TPA: M56 family metallopeptidase [Steroidobacteraceae bacterium]|nr:M56 family metallopeptidase [Steroidobacteraceae bacterium]